MLERELTQQGLADFVRVRKGKQCNTNLIGERNVDAKKKIKPVRDGQSVQFSGWKSYVLVNDMRKLWDYQQEVVAVALDEVVTCYCRRIHVVLAK